MGWSGRAGWSAAVAPERAHRLILILRYDASRPMDTVAWPLSLGPSAASEREAASSSGQVRWRISRASARVSDSSSIGWLEKCSPWKASCKSWSEMARLVSTWQRATGLAAAAATVSAGIGESRGVLCGERVAREVVRVASAARTPSNTRTSRVVRLKTEGGGSSPSCGASVTFSCNVARR
eukprot:scaffold80958_cov24-Tisochrysis_lutea.AAC.5